MNIMMNQFLNHQKLYLMKLKKSKRRITITTTSIKINQKKKINLNKPQDMYGLANQIKYNLHKFLNFYWPNPSVNELIACVLDPRVKALNFITSQKREEVFDILRQIYLEMCPEQLSMINTN